MVPVALSENCTNQKISMRELEDMGGGCLFSGPGRGDCAHFVGLPGKSIPGQHDGPDDSVDCYGKPNGWCWSCWKDNHISQLKAQIDDLKVKSVEIDTL